MNLIKLITITTAFMLTACASHSGIITTEIPLEVQPFQVVEQSITPQMQAYREITRLNIHVLSYITSNKSSNDLVITPELDLMREEYNETQVSISYIEKNDPGFQKFPIEYIKSLQEMVKYGLTELDRLQTVMDSLTSTAGAIEQQAEFIKAYTKFADIADKMDKLVETLDEQTEQVKAIDAAIKNFYKI